MRRDAWRSLLLAGVILGLGVGSMATLLSMRKPPVEATAPTQERTMKVTAVEALPEDVVVTITGYGEVRPLRTVDIAPEVSGAVVDLHPNLVVGGLIREGETLFAVDARTYEMEVAEAEAQIARWQATLRRLETEIENNEGRLETLKRTHDLAKKKYERASELFEQAIGNQTDVDEAEQHYNEALDRVDQLEQQLAIYPIRIEETRQSMAVDLARKRRAEIYLDLTRIRAPFNARVTEYAIEKGQFASRGIPVATLADDSALEIPVKLDAKDARKWLRFNGHKTLSKTAWFTELAKVSCRVEWTEDPAGHAWEGHLDRVEEFDPETRTLTVVVRVPAENAVPQSLQALPLVAGMFCEVSIPGRTLRDVYRLPQWAVTVDNTVYLAKDNRLKTAAVEILHRDDDTVFVDGEISPKDLIVTTRLINPLQNTLLDLEIRDLTTPKKTD